MNRDDVFIGRLEDYLESFDGVTPLPDRVRDAVHAELPRTRQVRPTRASRKGSWMSSRDRQARARWGLTAAVVLASVVLGAVFFNSGRDSPGVGAAPATVSPSPSPSRIPTPTPTPILLPADGSSVAGPGDFQAGDPFPIPVTVTLPVGWVANVGGPNATFIKTVGDSVGSAIGLTLNQSLYADPCNETGLLQPQPGPTVDDLATALANLPGFDATIPTEVTVDGYRGKQLTLKAPDNFTACATSPDRYRAWTLPLGADLAFAPGQQTTLSILDIDGQRLVISADTYAKTTPQTQAEAQQIVDSIRFVRVTQP